MTPPKGNKNAVKHGIYSKFIAVADEKDLEQMSKDKTDAELALARTRLRDANKERDAANDSETKLKWDAACRHWTEIITNTIARNVEKRQTESAIFNSLIEAVRAANDKQNVTK